MMTKRNQIRNILAAWWYWLNHESACDTWEHELDLKHWEKVCRMIERREPRFMSLRGAWLDELCEMERRCYSLRIYIDKVKGK